MVYEKILTIVEVGSDEKDGIGYTVLEADRDFATVLTRLIWEYHAASRDEVGTRYRVTWEELEEEEAAHA